MIPKHRRRSAAIGPGGALLLERNDEWAARRCRYIILETIAPVSDDPIVSPPILAG